MRTSAGSAPCPDTAALAAVGSNPRDSLPTANSTAVGVGARPSSSPAPPPPRWLVLAAFGAVYVIWGSTYLGIRIAMESIPPLLMAGCRSFVAGAMLYTILRARGTPAPARGHWRAAGILGTLMLLIGNGGVSWSEANGRVPSSLASLMIAVTPLWFVLIEWARPGGRRPGWMVAAGLTIGFIGVAGLVLARGPLGGMLLDPLGAGVLLIASLSWAFGSVFGRDLDQARPALMSIAMQLLAGGALMLAAGLLAGEAHGFSLARVTATSAWAMVYLTLLGSLVGFTAYAWLLTVTTSARVSTYAYVNPLVAVALGWSVGHEPFTPGLGLAAVGIVGAVVLITVGKERRVK